VRHREAENNSFGFPYYSSPLSVPRDEQLFMLNCHQMLSVRLDKYWRLNG